MTAETSPANVLERTARGAFWIIGWRFSTRLLGVVNTLVLVRILLPADFGLVALATSFIQAVDSLGRVGLEDSLIREQQPTRDLFDTAFTLGIIRALITAIIVAGLSWPAAAFFQEPRLSNIVLALAAGIMVDGFTNVGAVNFRRDFAFHNEFVLWVMPRVASIAFSITAAIVWRTYWALVVGILSQQSLRVGMSYVMHPYRPRLRISAWRSLAGYSLWTWILSMMSVIRDKTPTLLIGRMLGTGPVGLFSLGYELSSLPTTELVEPLNRAAFSGFSTARQHGLDGGENYLRMVASMAVVSIPAGIGIALVADPVVRLAFGRLWVDAVPIVQMLGICGALTVFGSISTVMFRVYGRMELILQAWLAIELVRIVLLVFLTRTLGLQGAALATAVAWSVEQLYFLRLTQKHFSVSASALTARLWRTVLAAGIMSGVLLWSGLCRAPQGAGTATLAATAFGAAGVGAVTYAAALLSLWFLKGRPDGAEADMLMLLKRFRRVEPAQQGAS